MGWRRISAEEMGERNSYKPIPGSSGGLLVYCSSQVCPNCTYFVNHRRPVYCNGRDRMYAEFYERVEDAETTEG